MCKILRVLLKYRLYVKLSKCTFNRSEVIFLKFVIKRRDIQMKQFCINAITSWSELKSAKNILIFLKFARFYRQFIREFSQIIALLTDLIKNAKKRAMHLLFAMTSKAKKAFERLKAVFVNAFILKHYDWNADLRMKIDASNREVEDVLSQKSKTDQWHLIVYYSYKFKEAEVRWDMHDKELYAIVLDFKNWRHYLQSSKRFICVITNHNNLCYFMMMKKLNARQMRWAEKLTAFDFRIEYRRDKLNFANASSRRLDIMKSNDSKKNNDYFLSTLRNKLRNQKCQSELLENEEVSTAIKLAALTMQLNDIVIANTWVMCLNEKVLARSCRILDTASFRLLIHQIMKLKKFYLKMSESMIAWLLKLQQRDVFVTNEKWRQWFASRKNELSKWSMRNNELLRRDLAVYVLNDSATRNEILHMNHDDFKADHFAYAHIKTVIRRKYYWSKMLKKMTKYVRICSDCQRVRVHHHKFYEKLMSISSESVNSFHTMIMNFITDMLSAKNSYIEKTSDAILIMIDKLIKHAIYISTIKDLNVERLTNLLWWEFVSQHEMMRSIISNRDSLFISHFWITLCWHLEAKWKLSTAFHLQINDQTERQNQMLEHYLRVYFNYKMNNWSELLSMTTFAYNNSVHANIEKTSHELLKRYTASFAETSENRTLKRETFLTTKWAEWLRSIKEHLMKLWKWVAEQQAKYYNAHHKAASFQMKDKVLLQSINIHTLRSKKKIDHRQLRSFRILKKINMQAYKLELSEKYDVIHSIFHVSLLRFWHSRDENSKLQIILVEEEEEWKIEKILDQRIKKEKIEYLVQWADSSLYENFWKSMKNLSNAKKIIENYETERQVHQLTAKKSKKKKRDRSCKNHDWKNIKSAKTRV